MNTDNTDSTENATKFINKLYDKLNYFDLYGGSVLIFLAATITLFAVVSYCQVMQSIQPIKDDWVNQRCKPKNIMFAGYINKPNDKTAFDYTNENFQYCVQDILTNISGYAIQPIQFLLTSITNMFNEMSDSLNQSRGVMSKLRSNIAIFTKDILARILNVMIPLQTIFISLMDTFNKIQGVMVSGLYTMLGSYLALQTLMGAMLELIIKILSVLVIIILGLWAVPVTWGAAATSSLVFLGISVPLALIVAFMTQVLGIQTSGIPKLRCYDECTKIEMCDNTHKNISEIQVGEILLGDNIVTAIIKVTAKDIDMYNLDGIIVSGNHKVKHNNAFTPTEKHPNARRIFTYNKPYIYCLNTSSKKINIQQYTFSDWDDILDGDKLDKIIQHIKYKHTLKSCKIGDIHTYTSRGYNANMQVRLNNAIVYIEKIKIGDILETGGMVYGIVQIDTSKIINLGKNPSKLYNLLTTDGKISLEKEIVNDYNYYIDSIMQL